MKVAITGKGGAGKTTVAATLARLLARDGSQVLAVDADPNPNLSLALGLSQRAAGELEGIANRLLRERREHARAHAEQADHADHEHEPACEPPRTATAEELVDGMGVAGPDGVWLVQTGTTEKPSEGCLCCGSHGTTRRIFGEADASDRVVIADLEAGVNDLIWARPAPDDVVVVVTEPSLKSLAVARRACQVSQDLGVQRVLVVANRLQDAHDREQVRAAFPHLEVLTIDTDPAVIAADRAGAPVLEAAPDCPTVRAVRRLSDALRAPAGV